MSENLTLFSRYLNHTLKLKGFLAWHKDCFSIFKFILRWEFKTG